MHDHELAKVVHNCEADDDTERGVSPHCPALRLVQLGPGFFDLVHDVLR
jgi:hypothetical protein